MNGLLHVSSSPHARSKVTTDKIMFAVLLALAPAACVGIWNFGLRALLLIVISMAVCPLTEYLYEKGMKKPATIADGSARASLDAGDRRCVCNSRRKTAFRRSWPEHYEPGACRKMLPFDFLSGSYDQLRCSGSRTPRGYRIRCDTARRSKSRRAGESAVHVPWEYGRNDR